MRSNHRRLPYHLVLLAGSALTLAACGSGSPPSTPAGGGEGSDLSGTVWNDLVGYPLAGGSPVPLSFAESEQAFAVDRDELWVGTSSGNLYRAATDGTGIRGPFAVGEFIQQVAIGAGMIWTAQDSTDTVVRQDLVVAFDPVTEDTTPILVSDFSNSFDGMVADDDAVYVLISNSFSMIKIDTETMSVTQSVPLGEDPSDPTGPRGDFAGFGLLGDDATSLWVLDESVKKLHQLTKSDLSITRTVDLSASLDDASFASLAVGDTRVFVADMSPASGRGVVYAIEKSSGTASELYESEDTFIADIVANGDRLIVSDIDARAVDGRTGAVISTLLIRLSGSPVIWVP